MKVGQITVGVFGHVMATMNGFGNIGSSSLVTINSTVLDLKQDEKCTKVENLLIKKTPISGGLVGWVGKSPENSMLAARAAFHVFWYVVIIEDAACSLL